VLKKGGSVQTALFPELTAPVDPVLSAGLAYLRNLVSGIHSSEGLQLKKKSKGKQVHYDPAKPKSLTIFLSEQFPSWQQAYIDAVKRHYDEKSNAFDDKAIVADAKSLMQQEKRKEAMSFVQAIKALVLQRSEDVSADEVFARAQLFNEGELLVQMAAFLKQSVNLARLDIVKVQRTESGLSPEVMLGDFSEELPPMADIATPGSPSFYFKNI
jgi:leucyl-tRNA synthetase